MELKGRKCTVEIEDMSTSGEGIGRANGVVVFVPGTVPGDMAVVEITEVKRRYARGRVAELVRPSADRVEPRCPYFGRCGGCTLQNMEYGAQLRLKEKQLRDKLVRIYGGEAPKPEPIVGADDPWHYRNKAQYAVYAGSAIVKKDGSVRNAERPRVGFYDGRERNIVECMACPVQSPAAEKAADALRRYIGETALSVYDEKKRKGRLRQMIVRTGFNSREVMVMLVVNGRKIPNPKRLTELMFQAIDSLNDEIEERLTLQAQQQGLASYADVETDENWYELKSLIINHNSNRTLREISTDLEVIYGSNVITDESAGLIFEISPLSFYQVNPLQMEKLYNIILKFADLKGNETVFDLYCGVGTIGLCCARHAKYVWGIESVKSAVLDANRNAVINGIVNIQFIHGKAEEEIELLIERVRRENNSNTVNDAADVQMIQMNRMDEEIVSVAAHHTYGTDNGAGITEGIADVIIVDPPRAGCRPELLRAIMNVSPEKIIYVSCDSGTLMRDLQYLTGLKPFEDEKDCVVMQRPKSVYKIERIRQVDQFLHTIHVETVVLMSRGKF